MKKSTHKSGIVITVSKNKEGFYTGFTCKGHAGYGYRGEDIVCASVSVLVINTLNAIEQLTPDTYSYRENERMGFLECKFEQDISEQTKLLLDALILGLKEIQKEYGNKYIRYQEIGGGKIC